MQRRVTFDLPGHVVGVHFLAPRLRDELSGTRAPRDLHVLLRPAQGVVGDAAEGKRKRWKVEEGEKVSQLIG